MELCPRQKVLILEVRRNEKVVLVWEASFSRPGPPSVLKYAFYASTVRISMRRRDGK
jgi:hypothetical protein